MIPSTLMLDDTAISRLKRHIALRLPAMRPSHRVEFTARGLGYRTYASLLSALREGPVSVEEIDLEGAIAFAERLEYDVDPDDVRDALCGLFDLECGGHAGAG